MGIPSRLVFAPLGAAGAPATMFAAVVFIWYTAAWLSPALKFERAAHPMRLAGILFGCSILITYVSANRHALPTLELNAADRGLIFTAGWLGVMLLAADCIDDLYRLKTLLRRIVLGATAMAVLGITQFFTGLDAAKYIVIPGLRAQVPFSDLLARDSLNRPSATALHPLEFGAVLALSLPLAIHQARTAPRELRRHRWLQVGAIGLSLPMTVSRSAILGLITTGLVLLPTWPKAERRVAYVVTLISSVAMWALVPGLLGTLRNLFLQFGVGSDTSTTSRTGAFSAAGSFISEHPWFGRGFGTFLPQTYRFLDDQYLGSLIETGIVGFLVLLTVFITGWIVARSVRRVSNDPEIRDLAQCLAASVAVATVAFATFDALSYQIAAGLTFLILGCIGAFWRLARTETVAAPAESIRRGRGRSVVTYTVGGRALTDHPAHRSGLR
jgi:O-antigen ligase